VANDPELPEDKRWILRVPFVRQRLGLGDVVEKATKKVGIKPCVGCGQRKKLLNKIVFAPK
jgi:hypothetical protein